MIFSLPLDLFTASLIFFLAACLGRALLVRAFKISFPSLWFEIPAITGVGLAVLSYSILGLGLAGHLGFWTFILLLGVTAMGGAREMKGMIESLKGMKASAKEFLFHSPDRIWLVLALIAAASNLVFSDSPPTQTREMMYDLTLPKIYLEEGRVLEIPDQLVFYYPHQIQMLYVLALSLKGAIAAKLLHYGMGLLSSMAVFGLGMHLFGKRAGVLAAVILYLTPVITSLSGTANIDLGTLFYAILAGSFVLLWVTENSDVNLYLAAFFSGVTVGTKVTGISVPLALFSFIGFRLFMQKSETFSRRTIKLALAGGICFLAVLPWPARNYHFNGNPAAPFGISWLGIKPHEEAALDHQVRSGRYNNVSLKDHLRGLRNFNFGELIYGPGPLLFALLLPALLPSKDRKNAMLLLFLAALNYFFLWLFLPYPNCYFENRYYVFTYGILAVLAGLGAKNLIEVYWNEKAAKTVLAAALIFPCLAFSFLFGAARLKVFLGFESQESYLKRKLIFYDVMEFANREIPPRSRVLMLGSIDAHSFYWKARTFAPFQVQMRERDPSALHAKLRHDSISHVLIYKNFYQYDPVEKLYKHTENRGYDLWWDLEGFKQIFLIPIYEDKDAVLFRVDYQDESNKA